MAARFLPKPPRLQDGRPSASQPPSLSIPASSDTAGEASPLNSGVLLARSVVFSQKNPSSPHQPSHWTVNTSLCLRLLFYHPNQNMHFCQSLPSLTCPDTALTSGLAARCVYSRGVSSGTPCFYLDAGFKGIMSKKKIKKSVSSRLSRQSAYQGGSRAKERKKETGIVAEFGASGYYAMTLWPLYFYYAVAQIGPQEVVCPAAQSVPFFF